MTISIRTASVLSLILFLLCLSTCSDEDTGSSNTGNLLGESNEICVPPSPLPFELVLWHEAFEANKTMTEVQTEAYLGALASFVASKTFETVFISVPSIMNENPSAQAQIKNFVDNLVAANIGIGIFFGLNGDATPPASWFDYSAVAAVVGSNEYILGLDSENYTLGTDPVSAARTMELIGDINTMIMNAGGPAPIQIAVAGGAAYKPDWTTPLVNVYEYYSSPSDLNAVFSSNINQPSVAFTEFHNIIGNGSAIAGADVPGWPAFSFEQSGMECLGATFGGRNCGSFEVLGSWDWNCVMSFLALFQQQYYPDQTPTLVLYQSDFLPCHWLSGGCPSP